ncbi:hypothetical protein FB451DRAFT_1173440 [Mycena latifolia]|nr:hypothetical protein FB451DRAFT_1173440 [Mycena latifolia]
MKISTVKVTYKGTTTLTISPAIGTTNILNKDGTVTIPATMDKIEFTVEGLVVASVLRNTTTNKLQILGGAEAKGTGSLEFNYRRSFVAIPKKARHCEGRDPDDGKSSIHQTQRQGRSNPRGKNSKVDPHSWADIPGLDRLYGPTQAFWTTFTTLTILPAPRTDCTVYISAVLGIECPGGADIPGMGRTARRHLDMALWPLETEPITEKQGNRLTDACIRERVKNFGGNARGGETASLGLKHKPDRGPGAKSGLRLWTMLPALFELREGRGGGTEDPGASMDVRKYRSVSVESYIAAREPREGGGAEAQRRGSLNSQATIASRATKDILSVLERHAGNRREPGELNQIRDDILVDCGAVQRGRKEGMQLSGA